MGVVPYGFTQNLPRGKYNRRGRYNLSTDKYNFAEQNITKLAFSFGVDFPDETGKMSQSDKRGTLRGESGSESEAKPRR